MITASTLAASAVREKAPIFSSISGASATNIYGWEVDKFKSGSACVLHSAKAKTPSVL